VADAAVAARVTAAMAGVGVVRWRREASMGYWQPRVAVLTRASGAAVATRHPRVPALTCPSVGDG